MIISGTDLSYEIPIEWQYFSDGNRLVLQGTNNEEIIISGSSIQGDGTKADLISIRERLFQNAVTSVNNAATHPELTITDPLERDVSHQELECWTLRSRTLTGETLFIETIITTDRGVTLITFEAPNTPESEGIYLKFIRSIRPNRKEA